MGGAGALPPSSYPGKKLTSTCLKLVKLILKMYHDIKFFIRTILLVIMLAPIKNKNK